ncbi:MAG: hypothetical protein J7M20_02835 [Deltaproteobacteria bacterium]|nr:hypothetical protein [Deltaproteobacteria bacterium]
MKNYLVFLLILMCFSPVCSSAEDFLGAPLPQQKEIISKADNRISFRSALSHDAMVRYYKGALSKYEDIKFYDKQDRTYIEDHGKMKWHSIMILKGEKDGAGVVVLIVKDNWTWIIGTLIIRYIGVFVVLMVICLTMAVSGIILPWLISKAGEKKAGAHT